MIRREDGFTMIELMITVVIFIFVIAAASQVFTGLLTQYKQQSKISETNIEGVVGLDVLRRDIEHGGYGLPWDLGGATYREIGNVAVTGWTDCNFSDGPPTNLQRGACPATPTCADASLTCNPAECSNPPAAFRSGDNAATGGSDVLVIKATTLGRSIASQKWTYVNTGNTVKEWDLAQERMITNDRVIVLLLGATRRLVWDATGLTFTTRYNAATTPDGLQDAVFAPADNTIFHIAYGVDNASADPLRMPFNRADYYMRIPATMPLRCAPGTGILYKAVVSQALLGGGANPTDTTDELPLLDCVADMQVQYFRDTNADGTVDNDGGDIADLTAAQVRDQVKEVRVSILAHEGQRDPNFTFSNFTCGVNCITVGTNSVDGRNFDLSTITNYLNYRWKIYTISIQPVDLR